MTDTTKSTYLKDLFINEAKPALKRHSGGGGGSDTSDATATPEQVERGAIFYTNGGRKEGSAAFSVSKLIGIKGTLTYFFRDLNKVDNIDDYVLYDDTKDHTNLGYCFYNAKLHNYPLLNTKKATNVTYMFASNTLAKEIPAYDFRSVTNAANMFAGTPNIENIWIKNIRSTMQVGSGTSFGHLLTVDSLIHLIKELRHTVTAGTLTVGATNLEKLANVYVRTIEITDEMRAEDDLIDEKLPFEVCESTDERAMLITEYVVLKNWEIN